MNKSKLLVSIIIIVVALGALFIGLTILPDTLVTQFGLNNSNTTMPKEIALLLPVGLCILFTVGYLFDKQKNLLVPVITLAVLAILFIVNI